MHYYPALLCDCTLIDKASKPCYNDKINEDSM